MGDKRRGYNLPKTLCIRERTSQGFCIRRTLSDDISTKDPTVYSEADVSIGIQPEEERIQRHKIMAISEYFNVLKSKKLWIPDRCIRIRCPDQLRVSWVDLEAPSVNVWLSENQLISGMTSEPERQFLRIRWWLWEITHVLNRGTQGDNDKGRQRILLGIWN